MNKPFVILFCFLSTLAQAQFFDTIQSCINESPRLDLRIDVRNSFVTTRLARIRGVKVGLDFDQRVKIGIGYNWLDSELVVAGVGESTPVRRMSFTYLSPYVEYVYYRKEKWDLSIPVLLGFGKVSYTTELNSAWKLRKGSTIVLYEPYMTAQYKVVPWFGLGFGVGYRVILVGNSSLNGNFNSPIYVFKAKVLFGHLYHKLIKEEND